jgi:sigma-B regulation protein RsbU (phosphoserine phosphatase)
MTLSPPPPGRHAMQCMEIWGGNQAVESAVSTPGLDVWVCSRPYRGAAQGGDVHYISLCGGGIITRLIVADVSGHGEQVAEFSGSLRTLMRRNINRKSPKRLVEALNRQFAAMAQSRRFATAVVATYLADRDRLTVCNAGHPRPLWYRAARPEWSLLTPQVGTPADGAANLPLGLDDETSYDQFAAPLGQGDLVVLYTNALIEAVDSSGRMLGEAGLLELVRVLDARDPIGLGPSLLDGVGRHRGGAPADDDATLLVLHHNAGPSPHLSIAQKLDVYAKVFGLRSV